MWARARYDLRLSSSEFYRMTPRQFRLLEDRHREHLLHVELVHAYTTQAVIHTGFYRPEEGVSLLDYMPNHPGRDAAPSGTGMTDEQQEAKEDYMAKVMQLSAELKDRAATGQAGPMLTAMQKEARFGE